MVVKGTVEMAETALRRDGRLPREQSAAARAVVAARLFTPRPPVAHAAALCRRRLLNAGILAMPALSRRHHHAAATRNEWGNELPE